MTDMLRMFVDLSTSPRIWSMIQNDRWERDQIFLHGLSAHLLWSYCDHERWSVNQKCRSKLGIHTPLCLDFTYKDTKKEKKEAGSSWTSWIVNWIHTPGPQYEAVIMSPWHYSRGKYRRTLSELRSINYEQSRAHKVVINPIYVEEDLGWERLVVLPGHCWDHVLI